MPLCLVGKETDELMRRDAWQFSLVWRRDRQLLRNMGPQSGMETNRKEHIFKSPGFPTAQKILREKPPHPLVRLTTISAQDFMAKARQNYRLVAASSLT